MLRWVFPKIMVPPNHPFLIGFSIFYQPFGVPLFLETPKWLEMLSFAWKDCRFCFPPSSKNIFRNVRWQGMRRWNPNWDVSRCTTGERLREAWEGVAWNLLKLHGATEERGPGWVVRRCFGVECRGVLCSFRRFGHKLETISHQHSLMFAGKILKNGSFKAREVFFLNSGQSPLVAMETMGRKNHAILCFFWKGFWRKEQVIAWKTNMPPAHVVWKCLEHDFLYNTVYGRDPAPFRMVEPLWNIKHTCFVNVFGRILSINSNS